MDAIVAQTQRSRQRSRQTTGVTAHDPLNENWVVRLGAAGETLFVDELEYPGTVTVGDPIDVRVQVVNAALNIGPADDDYCAETVVRSGYEYDVTVEIEGVGSETRTKCLQTLLETNHEFDFQAPQQPGTYTMTVTVEGTGTGFSGGGTREIEVLAEDDNSDRDDRDDRQQEGGGDNDDTAGDDSGSGLPDLGNLIGTTEAIGLGAGLTLLLIVLIATR